MSKRRVTQADVARRAGVSTTAVSLVLNGNTGTRLSSDTRQRITTAAQEMGYRPNLTARALSTQRSHVIGFISDGVTTGRFGNDLIRGALEQAMEFHYVLFIAETAGEPEAATAAVNALVDRQADGIIFAAPQPDRLPIPPHPREVPVVMLNATGAPGIPVVLADERGGGQGVVDRLLAEPGMDDVAVIGLTRSQHGVESNTGVQRRRDGIWSSLEAHKVQNVVEIACWPWTLESGYEAVSRLLSSGSRPRGLICLNDRLAFGAYRALHEHGLRVPVDVAVVSFDDDDIAVYLEPKLTTAAFPYREMGALAVRVLLQREPPQDEYLVPMPLRIRGSISGIAPH